MGRRRDVNPDDPPFLHRKGDVWYHVTGTRPRKWTALGANKGAAISRCEEIEQARMTVEQLYWARIDDELSDIVLDAGVTIDGGARDKLMLDRLRALLRKVSER